MLFVDYLVIEYSFKTERLYA